MAIGFGRYDFRDKKRNLDSFIRYMLVRTLQMFKYEGLPETLPAEELEKMLQVEGFAFVTEHEGNLYAFTGGLGGVQGVYGEPTEIVVSSPALSLNKTFRIDDEGILISNDYMRIGLIPLISQYGTILTENTITMILSTINKRINNMISVNDDNTAESARLYLKKLEDGELGFIMENRLYESLKAKPMTEHSSTRLVDLIELHQYTKASLYNELGLNSNFNMKKERLISQEIEINSNSIYPLVDNMLECRQKAVDKINKKYGTSITVEFASSWRVRDEFIDEEAEAEDEEVKEEEENVES